MDPLRSADAGSISVWEVNFHKEQLKTAHFYINLLIFSQHSASTLSQSLIRYISDLTLQTQRCYPRSTSTATTLTMKWTKGAQLPSRLFKCHWMRDNESSCSNWWFSMPSNSQGCEHDDNYKGLIYTTETKRSSYHLVSKRASPAKKHWTSLSRNHLVSDLALALKRPKLIYQPGLSRFTLV